jgi:putative endopeptidase
MYLKNTILAGAAVLALASCQQGATKSAVAGAKLLDPANMDTAVHPGDNFFLYANGGWLKKVGQL